MSMMCKHRLLVEKHWFVRMDGEGVSRGSRSPPGRRDLARLHAGVSPGSGLHIVDIVFIAQKDGLERINKLSSVIVRSQSCSEFLPPRGTEESAKRHQALNPRPGSLGPAYPKPTKLSWPISSPSLLWHFRDGPAVVSIRTFSPG